MPHQKVSVPQDALPELNDAFNDIRTENELVIEFPEDVQQQANELAANPPLPELDCTDIPFVTIDPASSMDLDQAVHMERNGDGYTVYYAIADVPAFDTLGSPLDAETLKRGQTIYVPDNKVPLHPPILSEDVVSLLPNEVRGAYVWKFDLDHDGNVAETGLELAKVTSRAKLNYEDVLQEIENGTAPENIVLLKEIGIKRLALETARGGVSLNTPTQEVEKTETGYELSYRPPAPSEAWNAQISLMTGMEAAKIMLDGKIGILRTMPQPDEESVKRLRRIAKALHEDWKEDVSYGDFIKTLDPENSKHAAILCGASSLFRGAGYAYFDGEIPDLVIQAAVAAPYAHTTAPLRRLVDRFVLPICEALKNGKEIPQQLKDTAITVPDIMKASDSLAGKVNKECINAVEAAVLQNRVGEVFNATVLSVQENGKKGKIQVHDPAVEASCSGPFKGGEDIKAKLLEADVTTHTVKFCNAAFPDPEPKDAAAQKNTSENPDNPVQQDNPAQEDKPEQPKKPVAQEKE